MTIAKKCKARGLEFIDSLLDWRGRLDFTMQPVLAVLNALDDPHLSTPAVHVAGTNGKGSVCAAVSSILGASGKKVCLTISPHLSDVAERVVIDGLSISREELNYFGGVVSEAAAACGVTLSLHECMTAIAFLAARELGCDFIVLEVGLGGRLDSTNVIPHSVVSAIVTIDFDHVDVLGDTLAKIAAEKAGIIKSGCPVVLGDITGDALTVILARAADLQAPIRRFGCDFWLEDVGGAVEFHSSDGTRVPLFSNLMGPYQLHNLSVACAISRLCGASEDDCKEGLANVFWPGRVEHIDYLGTRVILDGAHNTAGAAILSHYLNREFPEGYMLLFGALAAKEWSVMLDFLAPKAEQIGIVKPASQRAIEPEVIAEYLADKWPSQTKRVAHTFDALAPGLMSMHEAARGMEKPLVVAGSLYLVGECRKLFGVPTKPLWRKITAK